MNIIQIFKKTTYLKLQIISSSNERMNLKLLTTDACVSSFADVTMDFFQTKLRSEQCESQSKLFATKRVRVLRSQFEAYKNDAYNFCLFGIIIMCIKYVRTGLVREAQKTRARTIHASEMCFTIKKHIKHAEVRAVCVLFCVRANTKNTRHFSTHFYFLCVRVFLCVSYQPCALENTIERIYQKHDVNSLPSITPLSLSFFETGKLTK